VNFVVVPRVNRVEEEEEVEEIEAEKNWV